MILEALYELAQREELIGDPDYEMKPVAWLVRFGSGGQLVGIEGTHGVPPQAGARRTRPQAKSLRVPRQPTGRTGTKAPAAFLVDNAKYVFGQSTPDKQFSAAEGAEKSGWFLEQVQACAEATRDEAIAAMSKLLRDVRAGVTAVELPDECRSNDLFAFLYAADQDRLVHERPGVQAYWRELRVEAPSGDAPSRRCMVTGESFGESGLFPLLRKVPGGNSAGASLVSFNRNGFESHGWSGNENAPISRNAAEAAATALNRLLDPAFPDPRPETLGQPLSRRNFHLGSGTVVCYWAASEAGDEFADAFGPVMEAAQPESVGELYRSLWTGRPPEIDAPERFCALTLSGAQGRVMIREWFESTVAEVSGHLARHFADLAIVRGAVRDASPGAPPQIPLRVLLGALAPLGKDDEVPAPLASRFIRAGMSGTRYPLAALQKAVERSRAEIGRTGRADFERRDARAALIKAVLRRNTSHQELTPDMDPTNTERGYLLGRLMAVLERLQQTALGGVNATVIDRYFGAASATPQAVFPRLLKNARHHARKAGDDAKSAGTALWLDRQIDTILSQLGAEKRVSGAPFTGFPAHLALEQQGLFMLGYHQQRHWLWMGKDARERWTEAHREVDPTLPSSGSESSVPQPH